MDLNFREVREFSRAEKEAVSCCGPGMCLCFPPGRSVIVRCRLRHGGPLPSDSQGLERTRTVTEQDPMGPSRGRHPAPATVSSACLLSLEKL